MNVKIGDTLKKLRNEKNLTQEQLAQILNVSDKAISKWESDAGMPELDNLLRISQFFEITIDSLFKGETERHTGAQNSAPFRGNPERPAYYGEYRPQESVINPPRHAQAEKAAADAPGQDRQKAGRPGKRLLFKYILFTYLLGGTFMLGQIAFGARQALGLPLGVFTVQTCLILLLGIFHTAFAVTETISAYSGKTVFKALNLAFSSCSLITTAVLMCVPPLGGASIVLLPWLFLICLLLLNIYIVLYYTGGIVNVYFQQYIRLFSIVKLIFLGAFALFLLYPLIYSLWLLLSSDSGWWASFYPSYTGHAAWLIILSLFLIYAALNEASPLLKNHISVSIVKTLFLLLATASPLLIYFPMSKEFFLAKESFALLYENSIYMIWWCIAISVALLADCVAGISDIYKKYAAARTISAIGISGIITVSAVSFIIFLQNADCAMAFSLTGSLGPVAYRLCAFVMALIMIFANLPINIKTAATER